MIHLFTRKVESLCNFVSDTWEWEDTKGNWTEYSKPIVYLLEAAVLFGLTSIKFKEDKKELMVDLTKKVQTTKTGRAPKNVHRIKVSGAGKLIAIFASFGIFLGISSNIGNFNERTQAHAKWTLSVGVQMFCNDKK